MEIVQSADTAKPLLYDLRVDPRFASFAGQVLGQSYAMLGREDLAAAINDEYAPELCEPHASGTFGEAATLDAIAARAASTRIVIINESHYVSRHRDFTARLAERLRPLGYTLFAAETFSNSPGVPPPIAEGASLPYSRDVEGSYLSEAAFGRLARRTKALGYSLVAYEQVGTDREASRNEQVAAREAAQAINLAAALSRAGPGPKMLVHVGYTHAAEVDLPRGDGGTDQWMAMRLHEITGIDPLTVSQYQCRQDGGETRLAAGDKSVPAGAFDMVVDHPVTRFAGNRPLWREEAGDVRVPVPAGLAPAEGAHVIEARLAGEPDEAIPLDRVLIFAGEQADLLLPPGRYRLRAVVALTDAAD